MSSDAFADAVAHAKQHFEEGLIRAGFREASGRWRGSIPRGSGTVEVTITVSAGFPFSLPRVHPVDEEVVPWSWHREIDGALCLIAEDDREDLWWCEARAFLEHVAAWFSEADAGWSDDRPDLDVERYFEPSDDTHLYLLPDLGDYNDCPARFRPCDNDVFRLQTRMWKPNGRLPKNFRRDRFGYVVSLGELTEPPRGWADVAEMASTDIDLSALVEKQKIDVLVAKYERGANAGAVVLSVESSPTDGVRARRLLSASSAPLSRQIRSGPSAALLGDKRVAIVGLGAVGSFVADLLVRGGIRTLTLLDDDLVKPGNLVRHLVGERSIGLKKSEAVKKELSERHGKQTLEIDVRPNLVLTGPTASELLGTHDLVINATAEFAVTALLRLAAQADGARFLSVALQNDGNTLRIDILPPFSGEPLDPSGPAVPEPTVQHFEAGCGSPVSPTPPSSVMEASAVAVRHAVGMLIGEPLHPAGEVRHLSRQC